MTESKYDKLDSEIEQEIKQDFQKKKILMQYAHPYYRAERLDTHKDHYNYFRNDYIIDVDKVLNSPYYTRYTDKTQVFSFYKNDDITRRALHVQLVSRIARTIGAALNLNLDLIEAIALGHDIGHTPFGHAGEEYLNELYYSNTSRYFAHNLHSVRVLHSLIPLNLTLPTLHGILCHNGEKGLPKYIPSDLSTFKSFDNIVEKSYLSGPTYMSKLTSNSLEGCLVRICDMIAYVGKDRQDAYKAKLISSAGTKFEDTVLGTTNSEIINNLTCNIINHSYGKPYLSLESTYFDALIKIKDENSNTIYKNKKVREKYNSQIQPMMLQIYKQMLYDLTHSIGSSPIFKHHIDFVHKFKGTDDYLNTEPNQIVVDYIASMTDDYFIALHDHLFPNSPYKIEFFSYF